MNETNQIAARIGARIRHHLASPTWDWRYTNYEPSSPEDGRAVARLRQDAARARRWLDLAARHIDMPLPEGNGANGPWHRMAVIDRMGLLGILDIAAGRIAWTDTHVPSYVERFGAEVRRGISVSPAGGTGDLGDRAVRQIALTSAGRDPVRISPTPRPTVVEVEWGLSTCYQDINTAPTPDEWRKEWAALAAAGVALRETRAPQAERWSPPCVMSLGMAQEMWAAMGYYYRLWITVIEGGVDYPGCRGEAAFRVTGPRDWREQAKQRLAAAHPAFAAAVIERAAREARVKAGLPAILSAPHLAEPARRVLAALEALETDQREGA